MTVIIFPFLIIKDAWSYDLQIKMKIVGFLEAVGDIYIC